MNHETRQNSNTHCTVQAVEQGLVRVFTYGALGLVSVT